MSWKKLRWENEHFILPLKVIQVYSIPFFALVTYTVRTTVISTQIGHKLDSDTLRNTQVDQSSKKLDSVFITLWGVVATIKEC